MFDGNQRTSEHIKYEWGERKTTERDFAQVTPPYLPPPPLLPIVFMNSSEKSSFCFFVRLVFLGLLMAPPHASSF